MADLFYCTLESQGRRWLEGRKNIFEELDSALSSSQQEMIWMDCDSLGEFEQGLPVMEMLRFSFPHHKTIVTFFSS